MNFSNDPWENGWSAEESPVFPSSQILTSPNPSPTPPTYHHLFETVPPLNTGADIETHLLNPLVEGNYLTSFQRTKIMNICYDNGLVPGTVESNFTSILGLIALEVEAAGSGDFVSLSFRKNNLPDLPESAVALLRPPVVDESQWTDPLQEESTDKKEPVPDNDTPADHREMEKYINEIRDRFRPLVDTMDTIRIKEVPEKEGLLFKHINYHITHELKLGMNAHGGVKKVTRRYSDFVWLLEYLLQKYPFRVIPGLPPKKFSGASPDSQFLQRRRRGLFRFLNQLIKHPVLREEPVVITFLSVPTDISTWKKQAKVDYSVEFTGVKISSEFINRIWPAIGPQFLKDWNKASSNISKMIETWTRLVLLVERYEKRSQQIRADNGRFEEVLSTFSELNVSLYPVSGSVLGDSNRDDVEALNSSFSQVSEFYSKQTQLLIDDSYAVNTSVLEKFKNYLDYLYSLQELFERSKRLSVNTIDALEKKIAANQQLLNAAEKDEKPAEIARLRQAISNDKQEIFRQLNTDWLVKQACLEEFLMFQETQYLVSEAWLDWHRGRTVLSERVHGLWEGLQVDMPLGR